MYKSCRRSGSASVLSGFKQCQCCGWVEMISIRSSRSRGIPQRLSGFGRPLRTNQPFKSEKNWKMKAWSSPSLKYQVGHHADSCSLCPECWWYRDSWPWSRWAQSQPSQGVEPPALPALFLHSMFLIMQSGNKLFIDYVMCTSVFSAQTS